jgi:hypothetical protein
LRRISLIVVFAVVQVVVVCSIRFVAMSVQPLNDLWEAAGGQPYEPTIGKNSQFTVGITLLFTGTLYLSLFVLEEENLTSAALILSGYFGLSMLLAFNLKNLPLIGLPASLAAGY